MTSQKTHIGHQIAQARRERGLTQVEAAEMIGITKDFLSRVERGVQRPSLEVLQGCARVFSCEIIVAPDLALGEVR